MIASALKKVESMTAPWWQWCAGFAGILFIRFFIENLSSPTPSFPATPDAATLVHYGLFFLGAFVSLSLVLRIFIPDIAGATKFLFFGFPIIWLAPFLDIVLSKGTGAQMAYIFGTGTVGGVLRGAAGIFAGLTPGLRIELIAIVIGIACYIAIKTKGFAKAVAAGLVSYAVLYIWVAFPAFLALVPGTGPIGGPNSAVAVQSALIALFAHSHLFTDFVRPSVGLSYLHATETVFNLGMSVIYYLLDLVLAAAWLAFYDRAMAATLVKNLRPARLFYYFGFVILGALGAMRTEPGQGFTNWFDLLLFVCLLVSFGAAFLFAVGVNDIADAKIDAISNRSRPLPSGALNEAKLANADLFFLAWSLIGGFIAGYWALFAVLVFTAAYYIYSAPPLRLKRFPVLSTFLVSIASVAALMAGFYFADERKLLADLAGAFIILVIVCITLGANIKDLKDAEGDRAEGIMTFPALFGKEIGSEIVGGMLAAAFLAVPVILGDELLFLPSLAGAVFAYLFATARQYREWKIFATYFVYAAIVGAILWAHPIPLG